MDTFIILRESVGAIAIVCGIAAKWKLGNRDYKGWYWALAGGIFWTLFSCLIESPMALLNNILYFILSVRGLRLWRQDVKDY
jgi:hypothetical protein